MQQITLRPTGPMRKASQPVSSTLDMKVNSVMVIRKAYKVDVQEIWNIRSAAINSQCTGHYSPAELEIWTNGEVTEQFIEVVEDNFYVATLDGHIVGTGMFNIESGRVDAVFVHPARMRSGIGSQVLLHLEKLALVAGLNQLSLDSTLNAVRFYRAHGFVGDSVAKYESPRGISLDCIPMIKKLHKTEENT